MSENFSSRPQSKPGSNLEAAFSSLPLKGRYRVLKSLSHHGRSVLAMDEDTPSQTFCVVRSRDRQRGESPLPYPVLMRWEQLSDHPHLPSLLAAFDENNSQHLVNEYIHGKTAEEYLQLQGTWTESQIRQLLNQILPTLQDLHDRQLLHRDIKPQNLIERDSQWVLVDLSSLHCTATPNGLEAEALSGSAEYAAPEQIEGHPLPSSDLYSLGATCVHLLTGQSPFDLYDDRQGIWTWRDRTRFSVTPQLTRVLNGLLQPDLKSRYQNADDVLRDLNRFDLPINWDALLFLRPLSGLLATSFALTLLQFGGQQAPQTQSGAAPNTSLDKIIPNKGNTNSPMQPLSRGYQSIWTVAVSRDGSIVTGRGDGSIEIRHPNRSTRTQFKAHPQAVLTVAISPNGNLLATTGNDNTIKIWDMRQGNLLATWHGHYDDVNHLEFSPNGDILASAGRDGTVKLWDATDTDYRPLRDRNSTPIRSLSVHQDEVRSLAFSPNHRFLVTAGADGKVHLWDWKTGQHLRPLVSSNSEIWSVAVSPDGETLATGSKDGTVQLWNLHSGHPLRTNSLHHRNSVVSLAFSPTPVISSLGAEYLLASGDIHGDITLWHINSGSLQEIEEHQGWVSFDFTADGQSLVTAGFDKALNSWNLNALLGGE